MPVLYGWLLYQLVTYFSAYFHHAGERVYAPDMGCYTLPGFMLCLCTLGYPITWIQRYFMGYDSYTVFEDVYNRNKGYDNEKAMKWFYKLWYLPLVLSLYLCATYHVSASPQTITFKYFIDPVAKTYNYTQVSNIAYYRYFVNGSGKKTESPHYRIAFDNGKVLETNWYVSGDTAAAIVQRIGKPVDTMLADPF